MINTEERVKDDVLKTFGKYGNIELLEEEEKLRLYMLSGDIKKIVKGDFWNQMQRVLFLIVEREEYNLISIYSFRVIESRYLGDSALDIINSANNEIIYGKFVIDADGDVNWEHTYDMCNTDEEDIRFYLMSCIAGMKIIADRMAELPDT